MKILTKAKLTKFLLENEPHLRQESALHFMDTFFETIVNSLQAGEEVKLTNFGIFSLLQKKERQGRNPKTKEPVTIAARRVVTFYPSPKLRVKTPKRPAKLM